MHWRSDVDEFEAWYRRQPECTATAYEPVRIESIGAYGAKRGLKAGMRIMKVQGIDVSEWTLRKVIKLVEDPDIKGLTWAKVSKCEPNWVIVEEDGTKYAVLS